MEFLLLGYDGTDKDAPARRQKVREKHIANIAVMKKAGEFLYGGAILDDAGQMVGSMVVYNFPDRKALDEMLKNEPYIIGNVWQKVEISSFRSVK